MQIYDKIFDISFRFSTLESVKFILKKGNYVMSFIESFVGFTNDILWSYVLIILLIGLGIVFTIKTKFVQIALIPEMLRLIKGSTGEHEEGGASSFQAFCISTASRVGVGNIAGIAIAIVTGGPGAIFWMWVIATLGSATGFIESTLAQIYKVPNEGGGFRGGHAYYIKNVLNQPKIATMFAVLISITFGLIFNSVQANTIAVSLHSAYGFDRVICGAILSVLTGAIIFGGVKRIAQFTQWLVPIMAGAYIILAIIITILNIKLLPAMFMEIMSSAFNLDAAMGGGIGVAIMTGIKRGLFSNEAGMGSVPNAAAIAGVSHPVKQGLVQAFGVFVDTLMVCSASAFIILLSGQHHATKLTGIELAQQALSYHIGPIANSMLAVMIFMFAFSSIVGNYYYGESNISFMKSAPGYLNAFRIMVVAMVMFGSVAKVALVWDLADLFMGLMAITNLGAIAFLGKYAYIALEDYVKQKRAGILEPVFDRKIMPDQKGIKCWQDNK